MQVWEVQLIPRDWWELRTKRPVKAKKDAPKCFSVKFFSPVSTENVNSSKKVFRLFTWSSFSLYTLVGSNQQTNAHPDIESVTWFFRTKSIQPSSGNASEYLLQFSFRIAHIKSVNRVTKFLSRLVSNVTEKVRSEVRKKDRKKTQASENFSLTFGRSRTALLHKRKLENKSRTICCRRNANSGKKGRLGRKWGSSLFENKRWGEERSR